MKIVHKITFLFLLFCLNGNAQTNQDSLVLKLRLQFDGKEIIKETNYISAQKDTLTFESIRFYLSDFQFTYKDKSTYKEPNSYHLIDFYIPETLNLTFKPQNGKEIESIQYNIGIDSLASVSGAMEGDLDATKGMYWAWQSGFINMKIEGKSNSCKTRNNKFQFHIGGYLEPYYAIREIEIPIEKFQIPNNELIIQVDLAKIFNIIKLNETNTIMIPGNEAIKIADLLTKMFSVE